MIDAKTEKTGLSSETRFRNAFLALAVSIVLALLALWMPVWIAPPQFTYTPAVYLALVWVCFLAYLTAGLRRPVRVRVGWKRILLPLVIALVAAFTSVLLVLELLSLSAWSEGFQCQQERVSSSMVRYTCSGATDFGVWTRLEQTYIFEGPPDFPLVVKVGYRTEALY